MKSNKIKEILKDADDKTLFRIGSSHPVLPESEKNSIYNKVLERVSDGKHTPFIEVDSGVELHRSKGNFTRSLRIAACFAAAVSIAGVSYVAGRNSVVPRASVSDAETVSVTDTDTETTSLNVNSQEKQELLDLCCSRQEHGALCFETSLEYGDGQVEYCTVSDNYPDHFFKAVYTQVSDGNKSDSQYFFGEQPDLDKYFAECSSGRPFTGEFDFRGNAGIKVLYNDRTDYDENLGTNMSAKSRDFILYSKTAEKLLIDTGTWDITNTTTFNEHRCYVVDGKGSLDGFTFTHYEILIGVNSGRWMYFTGNDNRGECVLRYEVTDLDSDPLADRCIENYISRYSSNYQISHVRSGECATLLLSNSCYDDAEMD